MEFGSIRHAWKAFKGKGISIVDLFTKDLIVVILKRSFPLFRPKVFIFGLLLVVLEFNRVEWKRLRPRKERMELGPDSV